MIINEKKLKRQDEIIEKWRVNTKCKGTLEACTGFGKTYTAIRAIQRIQKKYPNINVHIIVPGIDLYNQWLEEIKDHNVHNCSVYVINTYIRNLHECDFLILDEIHRYASEEFSKVFEHATYQFVLGLTATIERIDGKHSLLNEFAPVFDTVSLEEARREGYVSDFKVYNLGLKLSEKDEKDYDEIHSIFNSAFSYFERDFDFAMVAGAGAKVIRRYNGEDKTGEQWRLWFSQRMGWDGIKTEDEDRYHPKNVMIKAQHFLKSMRKRKEFIFTASVKLDAVIELVRKFNVKTIVFSETSAFADAVTEKLGNICRSYHSNLQTEVRTIRTEKITKTKGILISYKDVKFGKDKLKKEIIDLFKTNKIKVLSTVRSLDEGFDDEEIELVIQASYSSGKRQDTQRTGRGIRVMRNRAKKTIIINLYIIGTQEEKWLKEKQKGKAGIKWVKSVSEIKEERGTLFGNLVIPE